MAPSLGLAVENNDLRTSMSRQKVLACTFGCGTKRIRLQIIYPSLCHVGPVDCRTPLKSSRRQLKFSEVMRFCKAEMDRSLLDQFRPKDDSLVGCQDRPKAILAT